MAQGLITLTNGSAAVSGAGTHFGTDNKIGDFIVGYINGQSYSLAIASIESPTALTLTEVFYGPTTASVPWDSVPLRAITAIPYQLGVQQLKALRLMNLESDNWLQMYTSPGDITVNLPDDRQYHGPSLLKLGSSLDNKADKSALDTYAEKGQNSDITSLTGLTTALSLAQGGTGLTNPFGTTANTFCQGNDSRLVTVANKTGGEISSPITVRGAGLSPKLNIVGADYDPSQGSGISRVSRHNGDYIDNYLGGAATGQPYSLLWAFRFSTGSIFFGMNSAGDMTTPKGTVMTNGSDIRLKHKFSPVVNYDEAGQRIDKIGIVEYQWKYSSRVCRGMLAQQIDSIDPLYTFAAGKATDDDGKEFEVLNVDQAAVMADLVLAVQSLRERVSELETSQKSS
ncbi:MULTISPECIES: tail fiber domain-containing protein [unclassified Cedecea]|uniref:tail fiber domain-containing protein n=1 Tax=unclassified Cedecea TaxID=2649846 RepID=UPI00301A3F40